MRYVLATLIALTIFNHPYANGQDQSDNEKLQQQNELLQAKLEAATLKIEKLEKQLAELRTRENEDEAAEENPLPLGSKWSGTFTSVHQGKTTISNADCHVTARKDNTGTFSNSLENGTVWEYDFELVRRNQIKLTAVRRIKAANGVSTEGLQPVGGTTGTGSLKATKLALKTRWTGAPGGPLQGQYEFTLDE